MKSARRRPSVRDTHLTMQDSSNGRSRELKVVFASVGCNDAHIVRDLLPRIADLPDVSVRAVLDPDLHEKGTVSSSARATAIPNADRHACHSHVAEIEREAAELCEWANLLVLAPIDAYNLAKMLDGHTGNLLLELLRGWNVSKKILLLPGMSTLMWENPMTKKQLTKIRRKWNWIQLLEPILWSFDAAGVKKVVSWEATNELVDAVRNQVDLMNIGQGLDVAPPHRSSMPHAFGVPPSKRLPPELWTMIFDMAGDWELAQALHVYTNLDPPAEWSSHTGPEGPRNYMESLEWTILRGNLEDFQRFIAKEGVPRWFSKLCLQVMMRFAMTPLLAYLESSHSDLFWSTFGHAFLPDNASSIFGRTEILEFWRTSPSFLTKEYNADALDGASRAGFVNVLEWWQQSGLPLKFTETALEQASSQGHLSVLEWWKQQSTVSDRGLGEHEESSEIRLKPGKSICYATQNGHTEVVRWWLQSGIPFTHEDTVAKLASTHGHVDILQLWHEAKGSKIIFDNQVLVGATKNGWTRVLEWWKCSGLKVEYRLFDIEEALEDGLEGERGLEVRRWWARNGLNLGVGTREYLRTKFLNA